jgi:hypothetical protein
VSWLWPRELNTDDRITIRIVRLLHWCVVGFAAFCLVVSFMGLIEGGDRDPIAFFAVGSVWVALAMLGRGFRYVVARE